MTLSGSGNVGIGTNAPTSTSQLHVEAAKAEIRIKGTNDSHSDEVAHLIIEGSSDRRAGITIEGDSNALQAFIGRPYDSPNKLVFETSGSERIRIDNTGKVGIGTNNPNALLQISGSGLNGAPTLAIDNTSTSAYIHSIEALGGAMTANQINIINLGKIGSTKNSGVIGYKWVSAGSDDNLLTLEHWGTGPLVVLDGTGKMGIGTDNPTVKLDVNGSALVGRDRDIGSYASDDFDLMVTNANNDATAILLYNDAGAYQSSLIEYYQNKLSLGLNNSNGDDDLLTTTAINITSKGVGIGVTPDDEWDTFTAMQIGEVGAIFAHPDGTGAGSAIHISANAYYDSRYEYLITDEASRYTQENGQHRFFVTSTVGSHGNAISFTEAMRITSAGDIMVGDTNSVFTDSGRGNVEINGSSSAVVGLTVGGSAKGLLLHDGTDSYFRNYANGYFATYTNNIERMRILNDGRVAIKATSLPQDFGSERGHLLISSVDNAGANNYGVLLLQGHSVANDVATGGIYFYDHNNNTATIQAQRDDSTSKGYMLFYTNDGGGVTQRVKIGSSGETVFGTTSDNNSLRMYGNLRMNVANSVSFQNASADETVSLWNGGGSNETVLYGSGGIILEGTTNSATSGKGRGQIKATTGLGLNASSTYKSVRTLIGGYQSGILIFHVQASDNAAATRCQVFAFNADYYDRTVSSISNVPGGNPCGGIDVQIVRDDGSTTSDGGGPYTIQARPSNGSSALTVRLLILGSGG